jgi:hypothetical protein
MTMTRRKLRDLEVSSIGLGCMGMSAFYGSTDEEEAVATIRRVSRLNERPSLHTFELTSGTHNSKSVHSRR